MTKGVELSAKMRINHTLLFDADLSLLDTFDSSTGKKLERRSDYKLGVNTRYTRGQTTTTFNFTQMGERYDSSAPDQKLKPFSLLNINVSYNLEKGFELWAKIYNLLNQDYQEVYGYQTHDRKFYSGVVWNF